MCKAAGSPTVKKLLQCIKRFGSANISDLEENLMILKPVIGKAAASQLLQMRTNNLRLVFITRRLSTSNCLYSFRENIHKGLNVLMTNGIIV